MKAARARKMAAGTAPNGASATRSGDAAETVGAQGVPLSGYPGWDAERGVFVQDDPRKRPSALIKQLAKRRPAVKATTP